MNILCYDPGTTKGHAWSMFCDRELLSAGVSTACPLPFPNLVVIEKPCWHEKAGRSPAIVGDLIDLGVAVGRLAERWESDNVIVDLVLASTWKRSVPKEIMSRRILSRLTPDERGRIPKTRSRLGHDHNVIDAIGIGLWKLGRLHGAG